jgi:hypothetical protein
LRLATSASKIATRSSISFDMTSFFLYSQFI